MQALFRARRNAGETDLDVAEALQPLAFAAPRRSDHDSERILVGLNC